jgi:hypothetical protein
LILGFASRTTGVAADTTAVVNHEAIVHPMPPT